MSQKDYTLQDIINLFAQSKKEYEERQKEREKEEQELREQMKRTDEFLSKKFAETDATLKKMGIHLGGISNNNGEMAEEFFYRSL